LALGLKRITMDEASLIIPRSNMASAADLVDHLLANDAGQALVLANRLVEEGVSVPVFMADVVVWLRNVLLATVGQRLDLFSRQTLGELQARVLQTSQKASALRVQSIIDIFIARRRGVIDAPLPQLPLELAIVESCVAHEKSAGD
jgi:DNA polymerase III gamma/tau subunit